MKNLYYSIAPCGFHLVAFCLVLCFIGFTISSYSQSQNENYIKTTTYKKEFQTSQTNPPIEDAVQQITYYDGLGRPKQQILHKQSGTGKDIISYMAYDGLGRKAKEFLPYVDGNASLAFRTTAASDQYNFYANGSPGDTGNPHFDTTTNPYSETIFEVSPLNRVLKQAAPGDAWAVDPNNPGGADRAIKMEYTTNTANEVKKYRATSSWNATLGLFQPSFIQNLGYYPANELYVTVLKDENWVAGDNHTTKEYKNKSGQVVLKRTYGISQNRGGSGTTSVHNTYYVYDDYGNLTYVIPPLVNTTQTLTTQILNDLCYQYKYDHRNRLVEKKLPGKQWEYMVYDKFDRPVATGPAHSPFTNITSEGWLITKYDKFDRPVITGWLPAGSFTSSVRKTLQNIYTSQAAHSENKVTQSTTINNVSFQYTNSSHPTSGYHILTIAYYDDYIYPSAPTIPASVEGQDVHYNNTTKPKGLPTGSWVRVPAFSGSTSNEFTYSFYDTYANPIRTRTKNHFSGYTEVDSKFDFSGKVLYTKTRQKLLSSDIELAITDTYAYTPQDRPLHHRQQIGQDAIQQLVENTYDELGQLIIKKVGSDIFNPNQYNPLQKVDYRYNVRGWLTDINNVYSLSNGETGSIPMDKFAFKINYNKTLNYNDIVDELYNGNIAETLWRSGSDNVMRSYGYKYDAMNRLT
ncbi:MAG: hypothetical protein H0X63_00185, partial [Flavobacteriales bacterium]|nr:hypothetical protein [Flavobacteriales bacterium]